MKIDLKVVLEEELQNGLLPSLEEVTDWGVQSGNFLDLLLKAQSVGCGLNIPPELFVAFVHMTNKRYGGVLALLVRELAVQGKLTEVVVKTEETNIPVEMEIVKETLLTSKDTIN